MKTSKKRSKRKVATVLLLLLLSGPLFVAAFGRSPMEMTGALHQGIVQE